MSSNDMESFNTTATYLSDNLQPLPYTPFAAMMAKQQQNYASGSDQDNRSNDTYSIGVLGKNSVKEVSQILTSINLCLSRFAGHPQHTQKKTIGMLGDLWLQTFNNIYF